MAEFRRDWLIQIDTMQREMERLLEHFASSKPPMIQFSPRLWEPAIDVYETDNDLVVVVELAGVKEEDIEIVVDRNTFVIRGERKVSPSSGHHIYHQMEVASGPFERSIVLPVAVEPGQTKASYRDGLVEVILPKVREKQVHKVQIKTAKQESHDKAR
jgi:HSP20 family protein